MPLADQFGWSMPGYNEKGSLKRDRPGNRMDAEEPMIKEFKLEWYNFNLTVSIPLFTYRHIKGIYPSCPFW